MAGNDELRAKARGAARAAADGHDAAFGTRTSGDVTKRITEAILALILPELDARVRAAREEERDAVIEWLRVDGECCGVCMAECIGRGEHRETEGDDE